MLYSCIRMVTVGVKGLIGIISQQVPYLRVVYGARKPYDVSLISAYRVYSVAIYRS